MFQYARSVVDTRLKLAFGLVLAISLLTILSAQTSTAAARPTNDSGLVAEVQRASAEAERTGKPIVHFEGGFWEAASQQAYIDEGARVARLVDGKLVDADEGIDKLRGSRHGCGSADGRVRVVSGGLLA